MNSNEELKFNEISHGNVKMSQKTREIVELQKKKLAENSKKISGVEVKQIDSSKRNDAKTIKKRKKALTIIASTVIVYLLMAGIISTASVNLKYGVDAIVSGSNYTPIGEENVPKGAYGEKFVELLNPIELVEEAIEVAEKNAESKK